MPQEPEVRAGESLAGYLARRTGVAAAQAALDRATAALAAGERGTADAYAAALEAWLALGGADLPERGEAVAARLALPTDLLDRGAAALSGGQAARLRLAAVLLVRADVLLLDEPTNDLDADGLAALEDLVAGYPGGLVVVSHDREFLARTATRVLELDEFSRDATAYGGGWEAYRAQRAAARTGPSRSTRRTRRPGRPWWSGPAGRRSGPGPAPAGLQPEARAGQAHPLPRGPALAADRRPRGRRPSASWPAWRWWTSRGTRGSCG